MSKNEIKANKFIKEYEPYYTQLETANRYIHENNDSNFDTTNLALIYKKLKKAMPANAPAKYNLDYYNFEFDADDGSDQTRFKIGEINGLPALQIVSISPEEDTESAPFLPQIVYKYPIKDTHFTNKLIMSYPKKMKFKGFVYGSIGLADMPFVMLTFNSFMSNIISGNNYFFLAGLFAMCTASILVICFVNSFFSFKKSKKPITKIKASSLDLINAINHIKGALGDQLDKYEKQINYRHVAAKHYKELSNGDHSWAKVKKEVQDSKPETIGSVLAREKVKYDKA